MWFLGCAMDVFIEPLVAVSLIRLRVVLGPCDYLVFIDPYTVIFEPR
jgi:hypothetical protein